MDKLYIIDAVNFLFRSYYAIGPMTNDEGKSTGALYGFIKSIQKLTKMFHPTHLLCVFDGPNNKKARQELYTEYKTHRKETPPDLLTQFAWAEEFCHLAGIPTLCIEGEEADDVMATCALFAEKQGASAFLCTSDKDLAQLVNDHIFLLAPHKDYALIDTAKVKEIFGVWPNQILDFLSITGDASDNIPGLEGFGPKTAAALLEEFGSLENLLNHPEKVKGAKKQQVLQEQKETALLSRKLATLRTHIPIPQEIEFYACTKEKKEKLISFYRSMKFNSLLKEVESQLPSKEKHYHLVDTQEELETLIELLLKEKEICVDTETTGIDPFTAEIVGIGFCTHPHKAWYIPCNGNLSLSAIIDCLKPLFQSPHVAFFGHNLKYDWHILDRLGLPLKNIGFDTILASYVLDPQNRRHNLDDLSLDRLQHTKIPIETLIGKGKQQISMRDAPIRAVCDYCSEDVDCTMQLKRIFEQELQKQNLRALFSEIELPLLPILAEMEKTGIYLDQKELSKLEKTLSFEIHQVKEKIFKSVGEEFNLNSPKQLSEILFTKLNLEKPAKGKTAFSTGADVLEELAFHHPIAEDILYFRSLDKLYSTYVTALPESIHPETHRIHCTFNQSVTATGRLSCQNPNLQNIPIRSKEGLAIRACFKPGKQGYSFIGADYSQIELRLLAHFSEDPELIKAFRQGEDVHEHTASHVFNLPITMVTPMMRLQAKTVNFGIVYGQGAFGLSKQLHISIQEASQFIKTYFERYPKIGAYLEECKENARKTGFAVTMTGRKRPIPEIHNKNPQIRAAAERLATNTPLQGTAADLIKKAMIAIDKESKAKGLEGKMILQIHDELIFEVPDREIDIWKDIVKSKMEGVFKLKVPIEVHIAVGKNWAEC